MARGFKATLAVRCWKEHACCFCGAAYRYLLERKQIGSGATQTDAVGAARTGAVRALRNTVEMVPCPSCGHYQPDMIGDLRFRRHRTALLALGLVWLALYPAGAAGIVPPPAALWLFIGCAVPVLLWLTWYGANNPNRSIRGNKAYAERLLQSKRLEQVSADPDRDDRPRPVVIETGLGTFVVFGVLALTVLLMPGAEIMRLANMHNGWPWNADWRPHYIGPGDTAWTWVEPAKALETRGGEWRFLSGSASVTVKNEQAEEKVPLGVSSRDEPLRPVNADEPLRPPHLWARIQFPKNFKLSHRPVRIDLVLNIAVPTPEGPEREARQEVLATLEANLGRPHAAFLYSFFWNTALLGGGMLFLLAVFYHLLCDAALKRTAPPTRVTALADDEAPALAAAKPTSAV